MTWLEPVIFMSALGVLIGLYQGHKGWGRTLLWLSLLTLFVLMVRFGPDIFYQAGCSMIPGGCS